MRTLWKTLLRILTENYCNEPTNRAIDVFNNLKQRVDKFKSSLVNPQGADNPNSFFYTILYALRYRLTNKTKPCADDHKLRPDVKPKIFEEID